MMDNTNINDTITVMTQNTATTSNINWWMWIAIAELIIIAIIIFMKTKSTKTITTTRKSDSPIDFDNILNSSFNAHKLYGELIKKCHPDRYPADAEKNRIATELSFKIAQNKNNYKKLQELKQEAIQKLNINFND